MVQYVIRRLCLHVQSLTYKGVCKIRASKVILISGKNIEEAQLHFQLDFLWDTGTTGKRLFIAVHEELGT